MYNHVTRKLMDKITFTYGGREYDKKYPDGIPTTVTIKGSGAEYSSGMVMYPSGHARNTAADLEGILDHKFKLIGGLAVKDPSTEIIKKLGNLTKKSSSDVAALYDFDLLPNTTGEQF